ncbi:MAG: phosphoglycerate dehydrogenase [Candidatus Tectomicrobia bacterium]|nr:phosphoglycerate dehydrogenase [Candidatus Tectomicrobia bacterium]
MKVLVCDDLSERGLTILEDEPGIDVDVKLQLSEVELCETISPYDAVIVRSSTKITASVIESARQLKVIGRAGIGVDNIDLDAATKRGIIVMNTPEGNVVTTAEHTFALIIALAKSIPQANLSVKERKWERELFIGSELFGKTLGIIGLGRIGQLVAKRAQGFEMVTIAYDPYISAEIAKKMGVELVSFEDLLKRSDYISIHAPKTKETLHLIGEKELAMMKDGVRIINCARGGLLDEIALYRALVKGNVAGAALDVYEEEPPFISPIVELDSVICTPHLGASTGEARDNVSIAVAEQLIDYFKHGRIRNAVNVISVDIELLPKLEPYLKLGEKLGAFLAQWIEGGIREVTVKYSGEVINLGVKPITVSVLKGLLQIFLEDRVNVVNAPILAKERGITVTEATTSETEDYASLIRVEMKTDKGVGVICGTLFGMKEQRIVRIQDYHVEAVPSGFMLVFSNLDTPGVIGKIGTLLGNEQINIAGMQLGRVSPGGEAVAMVNVDSPIPPEVLEKIRALPNIFRAKLVVL